MKLFKHSIAALFVAGCAALPSAAQQNVVVTQTDGRVDVVAGETKILTYQGAKTAPPAGYDPVFARGGYIHPLHTPSGVRVTDDYPADHKHHHGVWSPWTKTEFEGRKPDFWNMGTKTGTVEFVAIDPSSISSGTTGRFAVTHRMIDLLAKPRPKAAIEERWEVAVTGAGLKAKHPHLAFDLTIVQTCASESPLLLPKYHYGGLGFRGHLDWNGKDGVSYLTSEGKTRADGNETRARWCRMSGKIDGKAASVVVMDSPKNFRHPQPVRLHPTEPFFCYAPSQLGDWKIEPGKPYTATYRFVTADGELPVEEIERLYAEWSGAR